MKMIMIPLPKGLDLSAHKEGETFDVVASVTLTKNGLEVEAIEGTPVESKESPEEETAETEMDGEGFDKVMNMPRDKGAMMEELQ